MAFKTAGIKEVFLAPGSADFPTSATGVTPMGYKDSASLKISPFNEIKSKSNRVYPSLVNFLADIKSEQLGYEGLAAIIEACKVSDVSAKVVTSGVTAGTDFTATGGIFTFENTTSLGIDFELNLTPKDRMLNVKLEKAFKPSDANTLIAASTTDTVDSLNPIPGIDDDMLVLGYVNPALGGVSIDDDRLSDFKINLKTRSTKNAFNKSIVSKIDVDIFAVMDGADPTEINTFLTSAFAAAITIAVPVATPYNIVLGAGGLTQMGEAEIDDDKRSATVHFTGSYDIDFVDTLTGDDITLNAQLTIAP